eukprot:1160688-Pelagomonas_calceolata.AAC.3
MGLPIGLPTATGWCEPSGMGLPACMAGAVSGFWLDMVVSVHEGCLGMVGSGDAGKGEGRGGCGIWAGLGGSMCVGMLPWVCWMGRP